MKSPLINFVIVLFFVFSSCINSDSKNEIIFYVSLDGNDTQSGTSIEESFKSLEKARNVIRDLKQNGEINKPVTVYIKGGTYQLSKPFILKNEDSGTENHPITYSNYNNEKAIISGGLQVTEWEKTKLNNYTVMVSDLSKIQGYVPFEQLWINNQRVTQARTPNSGYLKVPALQGEDTVNERRSSSYDFSYKKTDEHYFDTIDDGVAVVFNKWLEYHMPIDKIDRENKKIISTKKGGRAIEADDDYYLEGGRAMLDKPGEWYLDRQDKKLYYFPKEGEIDIIATIPSLINVLRLEGNSDNGKYVEHVQFKGLTFSHTTWVLSREAEESGYGQADIKMDGAIFLTGAKNCLFEKCEITQIGNYGLEISLGCSSNKILQCDIHDLGAGGFLIGPKIRPKGKVRVEDIGEKLPLVLEKPTDATHTNEIADCRIYDGGKYFHCAVGIWIGQSPDNQIHHNEIYNFYYSAISSGWTWGYGPALATGNIFEYNYIHHIGKLKNGDGSVLSDLGGIYTLGDQTGTIIRNNEFHDIWAGKYGGWAIYCDEGTSNIRIENNLAYRCRHAAFNQHYGKNNLIKNNIFAFADASVVMMAKFQPHTTFILENNILLSDGIPIYAGGYEYNVEQKGGFVADNNLVWSTTNDVLGAQNRFPSRIYEPNELVMSWKEWQSLGNDQHSLIADPGFKDPTNGDFSLPDDSPALKIGFKPFPLGQAGPR
ncbi:right-handed parallel beta-helix repeat-containing protein [Cellulophaga sp. HaHaR_3_176]|uniref:right-handed parallel beta-helix repeat-containing protein n=1 Tax=Cellulophaga sp. HaHaR_3_176 TaxID=1942464 RepID=UPI001C1F6411|nr:right-handed parallel beta-helix repeat-containing protein [Cellulophaga sp. HaHaR_3_176]QWX84986.1 right-handed parallel beta-helix repeat-containing protein [Cellulophaga sp. HaHaR_3_176]